MVRWVDAVWRRLLERSGPRPGCPLTDRPDVHLLVGGRRLEAIARHRETLGFALPARPGTVRIVSRASIQAELGVARDPRILGVALRQVTVHRGWRVAVVESDDASLVDGFHRFEPENGLRWTNGDAALPRSLFERFDGPTSLLLHIGCTARYPEFGEPVRSVAA